MVAHHLPGRRTTSIGALSDDLRNRANGFARRHDDYRQDEQRQRQTGRQDALAKAEGVDKETKREQSVDDRRHAGQIGDVDLDDVGDPVLRRVFFKVDACRHANRHGSKSGDHHDQRRTDPGRKNAGVLRAARRERRQKVNADARKTIECHVGEQRGEGQHADHQGEDAENPEHEIPALVCANHGAHRLQFLLIHFAYLENAVSTLRGIASACSSRAD